MPSVNIGTRQMGRDRGPNIIDVGYDRSEIVAAIRTQLTRGRFPSDPLYGDGAAGGRIADLLARVPLNAQKRLVFSTPA